MPAVVVVYQLKNKLTENIQLSTIYPYSREVVIVCRNTQNGQLIFRYILLHFNYITQETLTISCAT